MGNLMFIPPGQENPLVWIDVSNPGDEEAADALDDQLDRAVTDAFSNPFLLAAALALGKGTRIYAEGLFAWLVGIGSLVGFGIWITAGSARSKRLIHTARRAYPTPSTTMKVTTEIQPTHATSGQRSPMDRQLFVKPTKISGHTSAATRNDNGPNDKG